MMTDIEKSSVLDGATITEKYLLYDFDLNFDGVVAGCSNNEFSLPGFPAANWYINCFVSFGYGSLRHDDGGWDIGFYIYL